MWVMIIKNKKGFVFSLFYKILTIIFTTMFTIIVGMNLFIDHGMDYFCKNQVTTPNLLLVIIGLLITIICCLIYFKFIKKHIDKLSKRQCNIILIVGCLAVFIVQLYYAYNIYFLTGWDVSILRESAVALGQNQQLNSEFGYYYYFGRYPNNVFLVFIFTILYKFSVLFNIENFNFVMVAFGTLLVNISIWFVIKTALLLLKNRHYAILVGIVYIIYIAFSPWIVIPYSDSYVLPFTIAVLYFYLNKDNMNRYIAWFLIVFLSLIGYLIKPTCIIVLIAIVLIEVWKFIFSKRKQLPVILKTGSVVLIAVVGFIAVNTFSYSYIGYEKSEELEFPLTHFLMMGMNDETKGVFFEDDVQYTLSFKGIDNKKEANLEKVKERLSEYGPIKYLGLLGDKLLTTYNDGTFAWGVEGHFYSEIQDIKNETVTPVLRSIVYNDGANYKYYEVSQQCIWITILALIMFSIKTIASSKDDGLYAIVLSLIGITLFLLLFEARARYLYLYSPYYIILACVGLKSMIDYLENKITAIH